MAVHSYPGSWWPSTRTQVLDGRPLVPRFLVAVHSYPGSWWPPTESQGTRLAQPVQLGHTQTYLTLPPCVNVCDLSADFCITLERGPEAVGCPGVSLPPST